MVVFDLVYSQTRHTKAIRDEAPALQPFREQACALTVMPDHLDEATFAPAEYEQMAVVRIGFELLLHQQRQTREALSHVAVPGRQPHAHAWREADHGRLRVARMRVTVSIRRG